MSLLPPQEVWEVFSDSVCLLPFKPDRTRDGPSTSIHAATRRPSLWCRLEQSTHSTFPRLHNFSGFFLQPQQKILVSQHPNTLNPASKTLYHPPPPPPQLHRGEDIAEAAPRDGLQREGRERRSVPVPRHRRTGGGLHRPGGPRPQGRGKGALSRPVQGFRPTDENLTRTSISGVLSQGEFYTKSINITICLCIHSGPF